MIGILISAAVFAVVSLVNPTGFEEEPFMVYEESEDYTQSWKHDGLYADAGLIMEEPGEIVWVTMQNGNVFGFYNNEGDWTIGDIVSVLFDDNGTPLVYDDIILACKYSGWVSDKEMETWIK